MDLHADGRLWPRYGALRGEEDAYRSLSFAPKLACIGSPESWRTLKHEETGPLEPWQIATLHESWIKVA